MDPPGRPEISDRGPFTRAATLVRLDWARRSISAARVVSLEEHRNLCAHFTGDTSCAYGRVRRA